MVFGWILTQLEASRRRSEQLRAEKDREAKEAVRQMKLQEAARLDEERRRRDAELERAAEADARSELRRQEGRQEERRLREAERRFREGEWEKLQSAVRGAKLIFDTSAWLADDEEVVDFIELAIDASDSLELKVYIPREVFEELDRKRRVIDPDDEDLAARARHALRLIESKFPKVEADQFDESFGKPIYADPVIVKLAAKFACERTPAIFVTNDRALRLRIKSLKVEGFEKFVQVLSGKEFVSKFAALSWFVADIASDTESNDAELAVERYTRIGVKDLWRDPNGRIVGNDEGQPKQRRKRNRNQ